MVHRGWNTDRVLVPGRARPDPPAQAQAGLSRWTSRRPTRSGPGSTTTPCRRTAGTQIDLRDLEAPSYAAHPWGAFYVHYTPDYYHRFLAELLKLSLRDRLDADTLEQLALIEAAAAEPAQRRLEIEQAANQAQAVRLEREPRPGAASSSRWASPGA